MASAAEHEPAETADPGWEQPDQAARLPAALAGGAQDQRQQAQRPDPQQLQRSVAHTHARTRAHARTHARTLKPSSSMLTVNPTLTSPW